MTEYFNAPHDSSFHDQRALHNSLHGRSPYNPYPDGAPRAARETLSPPYSSQYRPPRGPITYGNAVPEVRRVTMDYPPDESFRSPPRGPGMPMGSPMPGAARFREHDQVSPTRLNGSIPTHVDYGPQDTISMHPEPSWVPMSPQEDGRHMSFFPPKASTPAPDVPRYGETPLFHAQETQEASNLVDYSRYPEQGSEFVDNSAHYGGEQLNETVQTIATDELRGAEEPYDDEEMEEMDVGVDQSYGESAHIPGGMSMPTPYYSEPPHSVATHDVPQAIDLHEIPKPEKGKKKFVGGWIWGLFPKKSSSKTSASQSHSAQPFATPAPTQIPQRTQPQQSRPYMQSPGGIPNSTNRLPHQLPQAVPHYPTGEAPYHSRQNVAGSPDRLPNQLSNEVRPLSPRPSERSHRSRSSRHLDSHRSGTFSGSSSNAPFSSNQSAGPVGDPGLADDDHIPNPFDINPRPGALATPEAVHLQHADDYDEMSDPYVTTRVDTTFSSRVNRIGSFLSSFFHLPWMSAHVSVEYRPSESRRAQYDKPKKSWYSKGGHEKLDLLAGPSPSQLRSPAVQARRAPTERDRERARERRERDRERGERQRHRARSTQRDAQREREHQQRSRSAPARARSPASNSSSGHGRAATTGRPARTAMGATAPDGTAVFASPGVSPHGLAGQTISTSYVYPALWVVPPGAQIGSPQMQGQEQEHKSDGASPQVGQVQPNMLPASRGPSPIIVGPNVPYVVIGAGPWPMSSGTASPPPRRQSPKQRSTQRRAGRKGSSESPPPPMPVPSTSARRLSMKA